MVETFNTRSFLSLAFSLVTHHGQNDVAKATCLAIGRTSMTVSTSSFQLPTGKAMTSVHRAGERKRHTSSQVDFFPLGCRAWNVIPLGMSESLDGDPEEEPGVLNDVVGGDISMPTTDEAGIGGISREYFIVGGFLGLLSLVYDQGLKDERAYRERKQRLFRSIAGEGDGFRNILEVGIGGNPIVGGFSNLGFYRPGQSIVGIDPALSDKPSPDLENAQKRAMEKGLTLAGVGGVAEDLPFESGSFDAVVSTLVFCSVRDPAAALREVSRVLRPGGKFVFVEHVHAPDEGLSVFGLRQQQDLLDPLQQLLADGCHLTRETDRLIREASSGSPAESRLFSRIESIESVRVKSMWPVSEQVFGVVVK